MARLEEICDILDSRRIPITASDRKPGPYPYYGANGIQDYVSDYIFDDELVLLAEDGGNFGSKEKPIAYRVSGKCWVNNHAHVLKPKDMLDVDYLCYSLMFYDVSGLVNGATRQKLTQADMRKMEIPLRSMSEQKRITAVINKVSDLISLRKQQLAKLDELVKARFVELFGATSADKCSKQIKDYAEVLGGYAFKSDMFCTNAVPVIRISNINNGCVDPDYDVCYDELFWEQNKRFRAEQNDILMAMSGATTGKAGLYKEDMPALINQRVACIRAKDGIAYPTFLFVATQLEWMYDLIQETSAGCAQPNISGKQIENMPVPDATYEQQQQFAAFVEQTDKSKLAIQQSLDKLETLKRSLMQKYFG